jgi:hypothetical protein
MALKMPVQNKYSCAEPGIHIEKTAMTEGTITLKDCCAPAALAESETPDSPPRWKTC